MKDTQYTKTRRYVSSLILLAIQVGLFTLWQFVGEERAGNIFRGVVATLTTLQIVACLAFLAKDDQVDPDNVNDGFVACIVVAKMLMLLYAGAFWLYGWYMVGVVLGMTRIMENRSRREKAEFELEQAEAEAEAFRKKFPHLAETASKIVAASGTPKSQ